MFQREDRSVLIDVETLLLTVDECLAWSIAETEFDVGSLDVRHDGLNAVVVITVTQIDEFASWRQLRVVEGRCPSDVVVGFVVELQFHVVHIHHLIDFAGLKRTVHVVL